MPRWKKEELKQLLAAIASEGGCIRPLGGRRQVVDFAEVELERELLRLREDHAKTTHGRGRY